MRLTVENASLFCTRLQVLLKPFECLRTQRSKRTADVCGLINELAAIPDTEHVRTLVVNDPEITTLPVRSALFKQRTGG